MREWITRLFIVPAVVANCASFGFAVRDFPALASPASDADVGTWNVEIKTNKLDGRTTISAVATVHTTSEKFELTAECKPFVITIRFAAFDLDGHSADYRVTTVDNGRSIRLRSRLDSADLITTSWSEEYANETGLMFVDPNRASEFIDYLIEESPVTSEEKKKLGLVVELLKSNFFGARDAALAEISAGNLGDFVRGRVLAAELPLANRHDPVISIDLQSESFRQFISECHLSTRTERPNAVPPAAPEPETDAQHSPAFRQGLSDRQTWEDWVRQQSGPFLDGINFWAAHRSEHSPPSCESGAKSISPDFLAGCEQAKARLRPIDRRRNAEPDYRQGWTSL